MASSKSKKKKTPTKGKKKRLPAAKKKMGRPSKLDADVVKNILEAVGIGAPYELAALYAGVHRTTINRWKAKGEREESGEYRDFCIAIKKAEGQAIVGCLGSITLAAKKQWQAAAWLLERRYPETYGRKFVTMEHRGEVDLTPEEAQKSIDENEVLLKRHGILKFPVRTDGQKAKRNGKGRNGAQAS